MGHAHVGHGDNAPWSQEEPFAEVNVSLVQFCSFLLYLGLS